MGERKLRKEQRLLTERQERRDLRGEEASQGTVAPGTPGAVLFWKEGESYAARGASPLRTEKLPLGSGLEGVGPLASVLGEERGREPDGSGLRSECGPWQQGVGAGAGRAEVVRTFLTQPSSKPLRRMQERRG